ncbi:MAG: family 16 glycosylhydrolase [Bacteroidetes bacterium]|nr:family 16 glycosylhydrolase [Bacteroidota bacterium]
MKSISLFTVLTLFYTSSLFSQCQVLVWADEFDSAGLPDQQKWKYQVGAGGWGNNELQYYTNARSENSRVENGNLIIEARKEAYKGSQYTSARISSKFAITYGRVEMRAQLPHGRGTWAAMWMYPNGTSYGNGGWPDNGEIDIMEYVGHDSNVVHASVHSNAYNWKNKNVKTNWQKSPGLESGFHIYALEWDTLKMDFYIDNIKYMSVTNDNSGWQSWPFDKDFHLILNMAIGGSWGGEKGVDNTIFPAKYVIDYVRMYSSPGTYLPIAGPTKVFSDSVYTYSVPKNDGDVFHWTLPVDASIVGIADSNVIKVKWGAADGKVILKVDKTCGTFADTLLVYVYDTLLQTSFAVEPWPIPGRIQSEDFDKGGKGRAYYDNSAGNTGSSVYRAGEDVDLEKCMDADSSQNLGWVADGEWLEYSVDVDSSAYYNFNFRVASISEGGAVHIEMNGVDVTGKILIPNTGGWQTWQTKKVFYKALTKGKQFMRLVIETGGFNLNYIDVTKGTTSDVGIENNVMNAVAVYPNPVESTVLVSCALLSNEDVKLSVCNSLGQEVYVKNYVSPTKTFKTELSLSQLPAGIYFLSILQADKIYVAKIFKQN